MATQLAKFRDTINGSHQLLILQAVSQQIFIGNSVDVLNNCIVPNTVLDADHTHDLCPHGAQTCGSLCKP